MDTKYRNPHAVNARMRHAGYHSAAKRPDIEESVTIETGELPDYECPFWHGYRTRKCMKCHKCLGA